MPHGALAPLGGALDGAGAGETAAGAGGDAASASATSAGPAVASAARAVLFTVSPGPLVDAYPRLPRAILRRSIVSSYSFASTPSSSATSRSGRPLSVAFLTITVALS